ncbi:MAG: cache domain-containing protein [Fibrobacteres bacterium]|nr:cache domain-containing protein [Fibrobacterota bacterium]
MVFKFFIVFLSAFLSFAHADEKDDAVILVKNAVSYYKKYGKEKTLETLTTAKNEFVNGELYVFVYDTAGVMKAHPVNKKLIGKCLVDIPDVDGKLFRKEIVNLAKSKKPGWVDYKYKNPATNKIEDKTTYVMMAGELIFCCGAYR